MGLLPIPAAAVPDVFLSAPLGTGPLAYLVLSRLYIGWKMVPILRGSLWWWRRGCGLDVPGLRACGLVAVWMVPGVYEVHLVLEIAGILWKRWPDILAEILSANSSGQIP